MTDWHTFPARSSGVHLAGVDDRWVVYDTVAGDFHHVNATAALVRAASKSASGRLGR